DKRIFIVLPICLVIVIGWQLLWNHFNPPPPRVPPPAQTPSSASAPNAADDKLVPQEGAAALPAREPRGPVQRAESEQELVIQVGDAGQAGSFRAVFTNKGATLKTLSLGDYPDKAGRSAEERLDSANWTRVLEEVESNVGRTRSLQLTASLSAREYLDKPLEEELWNARELTEADGGRGVEYTLAPGTGVVFRKRLQFRPGSHDLDLRLEIENEGVDAGPKPIGFVLTPAACMPRDSQDAYYYEPQALVCAPKEDGAGVAVQTQIRDESGAHQQGAFTIPRPPIAYAGVQNKYFAVLLRGQDESAMASLKGASWRGLRDEAYLRRDPAAKPWRQIVTDVQLELALPAKGQKQSWNYRIYAGPKDRDLIVAADPKAAALVEHDLGFFTTIANALLSVLEFFHKLVGNWGVAIILLTLAVKGLLFPIQRRSQTAMAQYQTKMKRLQPRIEELKERYKNDRAKLNQEQAKLMQTEGAFPPLGGCLPMFLQIPVFFGLFSALRVAFELRQAEFLWIPDLSLPDHTIHLGWDFIVPIVGWDMNYFNILPPLMIVMWIWQQKGMPVPADENAARMQKMMMWMPVIMGVFLYNYAAGLSLYMITQSGIGVIEQKVIRKYWPLDEQEKPAQKGFLGKLMDRAQEAQKQADELKRQRNAKRGR
ncbi:MAG: membrane protein insertase YidC, partial [Planctomycetia bacterium]